MMVGGRRVDLRKITMPVLNFYGQYDHLVPPDACNKLCDAVGSTDTEDISLKTGHIGIYVSSKCQQQFTPKIVQWLAERESQATRSPTMARSETTESYPPPTRDKIGAQMPLNE
jgi:polyhydroxyalkanoate synthase